MVISKYRYIEGVGIMCKGVGIRDSACNIDTPVISELNKLKYNLKYLLFVYTLTLYLYIKFGNI